MAQKKSTSKKVSQKVQKIIKGDVIKSVAIASVLLNVLFLVSIFVLGATDTFDRRVYVGARTRYCENHNSVKARAKVLGSEKAALSEREIDCVGEKFQPFYKEALDKYKAEVNK
jgi:hypothetical protein